MSNVILINKSGFLKQLNLADAKLPADNSWKWAEDSLSRVIKEWQDSNHVCMALGQQFTNNKGFSIITEGDLTDVYRHFLEMPESEIAKVADQLTLLAGASISQPVAGGQHCHALAFAATPHRNGVSLPSYGGTLPQSVIVGSPYREGANIVAHELTHTGDRNVAGITGLHSNSPLFEMVMELDRVHSGNKSALAHTEAFYRQAGGVLGNTRNEETLARMVENVVHNPEGEFHPLVKAYVNGVFFKDMELKVAGREDMRAALHREITGFANNPLYEAMKNPGRTMDTDHTTKETLSFIDTISQRFGFKQPAGKLADPPALVVPKAPIHVPSNATAMLSSATSSFENITSITEQTAEHGGKVGWIIGGVALAGAAAVGLWGMFKSKQPQKENNDSRQERMASNQNANFPHPADSNNRSWTATVDASRSGIERSLLS